MCDTVGEVRDALQAIVAGLDPDSVALPVAPAVWEHFDAVERLAGAAKVLLARRVDASRAWRRAGYRSAAEYLAAKEGGSVGGARQLLETSEKLSGTPRAEAALRDGTLSAPQDRAVVDAASANPAAEARLVGEARRASLTDLRAACAAKAAADPDPEATWRRLHAERRLRQFTDPEGAWNLTARGTPDAGARLNVALEPVIDELFASARAEGRHEPREAYAFDALITLARRAADGGDTGGGGARRRAGVRPRFLALLRVDDEALLRGAVQGEEVCEIGGIGPVPVGVARELLDESVLKLVVTRGVDVANLTHLGRGPSAAQRIALRWASPTCSVEGCNAVRTQVDHRLGWAETHHTRLDELDPLCKPHHDRKTYDGWALVEGTGKRAMVPPGDPRHPGRLRPQERPPPAAGDDTLFDDNAA